MSKIELKLIKTYRPEDFAGDLKPVYGLPVYPCDQMMEAVRKEFKPEKHVGMVFYESSEQFPRLMTMGYINVLGGVCDDCSIDNDKVTLIELFEMVVVE